MINRRRHFAQLERAESVCMPKEILVHRLHGVNVFKCPFTNQSLSKDWR
ncbi:hypothetical protein RBSH_05314 [Rhodopirellula baltica SH28]|uniref:Uncharacterized protein n=1 Tax=Rhodopirellula baltica SH28 TaxID=993517 RepID=K5DA92_RHOBT|nr:hypothetical protein RBSH_05314 [Rhodopirellula baltica SH28]